MSAAQELHDGERALLDAPWLYRQGDLVLGPVTGHQLVEKLYAGELTALTEVSSTGPSGFRKLQDTEGFALHVAKATVKLQVEAEARALRSRRTRQRLVAGGFALCVLGGLGLGAWQLARYAAVYMPGPRADEVDIQVDAPVITPAHNTLPEERFEYPGDKHAPDHPTPPKVADSTPEKTTDKPDKPEKTTDKPEKVASLQKPERRPVGKVSTDADGLSTEVSYDQASINKVVKTHQSSLFPCFKAEAARRPGFVAKVPLEFTIGNDGHVAQLWIDHPQLKKGELFDCLLGEMKKWPFKAYTGERATVNLAFTIGKKG